MNRYINAGNLLTKIKAYRPYQYLGEDALSYAIKMVELEPSADVRENVRGEWIRRDSRYVGWISFDCSVCGETLELDRETSNDFKYCPFCGAQMRGDKT